MTSDFAWPYDPRADLPSAGWYHDGSVRQRYEPTPGIVPPVGFYEDASGNSRFWEPQPAAGQAVPTGWYDYGPVARRWWDGTQWTKHLVSSEPQSSVPAGWYDDGSGRMRWWDGQEWTEHFAPASPEPSGSSAPVSAPEASSGALGFTVALEWPLLLEITSDPVVTSNVEINVFAAFEGLANTYADDSMIAKIVMDEYAGPALRERLLASDSAAIARLPEGIRELIPEMLAEVRGSIADAADDWDD